MIVLYHPVYSVSSCMCSRPFVVGYLRMLHGEYVTMCCALNDHICDTLHLSLYSTSKVVLHMYKY